MNIGDKKEFLYEVSSEQTAKKLGSGDLEVLATPILVAYFENASKELIKDSLEEGNTTVGMNISINHLAPSKVGAMIKVYTEVTNIEKRIITFSLKAYDGETLIGEGTHKRCVVNEERFLSKLK